MSAPHVGGCEGGRGQRKEGEKEREEKGKRERDRKAAVGWLAQAVEGTVGALNPFKYNQYWGVPSTLSVIWMIFTVHSYNPRRARAQMHTYAASLSFALFRLSSPLFDREEYPLTPSAPPALIAVPDHFPSPCPSSTLLRSSLYFLLKTPPSCQRNAPTAIGPRI